MPKLAHRITITLDRAQAKSLLQALSDTRWADEAPPTEVEPLREALAKLREALGVEAHA